MNAKTTIKQQCAIVYDGDCIQDPTPELFDPERWLKAGLQVGQAAGRGNARFIDAPFGEAVLRPYLRGGWPARLSHDRYLFTGYRRSRPFREFMLLSKMRTAALRVPEPLAALCRRQGMTYTGALLTRRLTNVVPLGDLLSDDTLDESGWLAVGSCIRRFHDAGVWHADLNARNILVRPGTDDVFLVDFDRSTFSPGQAVDGQSNLARLQRSLLKIWPQESDARLEASWRALLSGYHG